MDIEQAVSISLTLILNILRQRPTQQKNNLVTYRVPFIAEGMADLIIDIEANRWFAPSVGKEGNTVGLVMVYLETEGEGCTEADALRWIETMCGYGAKIEPIQFTENIKRYSGLTVLECGKIKTKSLIRHIETQKIPLSLAQRYLNEIRLYDKKAGKSFRCLGLRNEDGGFYAFSPNFRGFIGKRNITFIRGTVDKPDHFHVFNNVLDFMSMLLQLEDGKPLAADVIILNSYARLTQATPFIKGYGYKTAFSWLDNNRVGQDAAASLSDFFKTEDSLLHLQMNGFYKPYVNVHAWHVQDVL